MSIQVEHIVKSFGEFRALKDVNLEIQGGELVALLGPSGCGKTTLLRIIAGLEAPDSGRILFQGEDATDRHVRERQVGFVFQHYALFRHMTVFENIAFGLRVRPRARRPSEAVIRKKVQELLDLVQLGWLANRYPAQLSGGQRQRIALARALAVEPKVLLLDEPFGALDAKVRKELRRWLRRLHDELHVTSVFVTHDQEEALEVADRVVVLSEGRVEQVGTSEEVYDHPASPFVYQFLGDVNLFHGRVDEGIAQIAGTFHPLTDAPSHQGERLFFARPHDIEIALEAPKTPGILAILKTVRSRGALVRLEFNRVDGQGTVEVELTRDTFAGMTLERGATVSLVPRRLHAFLADGREALN